jgi:DNA modification methylase
MWRVTTILELNKIYQGDCLDVMKDIDSDSIDTIITDPPYGLSFMGKKWDYDVPSVEIWKECLRVLKPGGTALIFAGSRTQHRMAVNIEDVGFILKDTIMWLYGSGFPKATDISKQIQKYNKVKPLGKKPAYGAIASRDLIDNRGWNNINNALIMPEPTGEAKLWNGYKSHGLKPAYEPIIMAVKPNDGSYAENALKWGVSGLNIDESRIEYQDETDKNSAIPQGRITTKSSKSGVGAVVGGTNDYEIDRNEWKEKQQGRFPANIILDEEVAKNEDWKRYFYCAKASKAERNMGCEGLEAVIRSDRNAVKNIGANNPRNRTGTPKQNHHPTVKPLKLMQYLVTLTSMPSDKQVYLDPFAGSGTTLIACKMAGKNYIGIEREAEYIEIANKRIEFKQQLVLV